MPGTEFESKVRAIKTPTPDELSDSIKSLFGRIVDQGPTPDGRIESSGLVGEVQDMYDEDISCGSDHGTDKVYQAIWELRIQKAQINKGSTVESLNSCPRGPMKATVAGAGE